MRTIECHTHRIIEIELTQEEVRASEQLGIDRTRLNEQQLGWTYRHHGKRSEDAHAVGDLGEIAVEKWFNTRDVRYGSAPKLVTRYEDIKQDLRVGDTRIGVKSMEVRRLSDSFRYATFLYPAKRHPDERFRILDYPDYLIQAAVARASRMAWLIGFVPRKTIVDASIRTIVGKPAHSIPHQEYRCCEELVPLLLDGD